MPCHVLSTWASESPALTLLLARSQSVPEPSPVIALRTELSIDCCWMNASTVALAPPTVPKVPEFEALEPSLFCAVPVLLVAQPPCAITPNAKLPTATDELL